MIRYDPILLKYVVGDTPIDLTLTELRVLNLLRFYSGKTLQRNDIVILAFGGAITSNSIAVHVDRIRKKLGAAACYLHTGRYQGYRWEEPC